MGQIRLGLFHVLKTTAPEGFLGLVRARESQDRRQGDLGVLSAQRVKDAEARALGNKRKTLKAVDL